MDFEEYVNNLKRKISIDKDNVLFICIGTTEILWDSLGPLVGSYLKEKIDKEKVIGDINNNICSKWDLIYYYPKIKNKFVIAIDTAISNKELEGKIFITNRPTIMGLALNKNKGIVGDVSIKVGISDIENITQKHITNMAQFIAKGIYNVFF